MPTLPRSPEPSRNTTAASERRASQALAANPSRAENATVGVGAPTAQSQPSSTILPRPSMQKTSSPSASSPTWKRRTPPRTASSSNKSSSPALASVFGARCRRSEATKIGAFSGSPPHTANILGPTRTARDGAADSTCATETAALKARAADCANASVAAATAILGCTDADRTRPPTLAPHRWSDRIGPSSTAGFTRRICTWQESPADPKSARMSAVVEVSWSWPMGPRGGPTPRSLSWTRRPPQR
mmetsp:Transcript_16297/g.57874  ORF Transcript_16297/g.57874 Transcript_16297/m.57874 type:complete len:245 (+) Transcript_16297:1215-1949(+)